MKPPVLLLAVLAGALCGCASLSDNVVFVTKTSLAVDVTAQPAGATIGYDRFEGYVGPRFDSGRVPPVAASFVSNGQLLSREVRQVYATGRAAELVTAPAGTADTPAAAASAPADDPRQVMFFSTGTTLGLKLGFGATGVTDWFTLGYKRREITVIPITTGEFPSVLATVDSDQAATAAAETRFGVGQYFATGTAARAVAADDAVRALFRHRVKGALGADELQEKSQAESALLTLSCLSALPDAELPRVFDHAASQKLFEADRPGLPAELKALPAAQARSTYTRYLAASDGRSPGRGQTMDRHRALVCALAGR